RRSYLQMPAWEDERRTLLQAGVHLLLLTQPLSYEAGSDGRLTGLRIARTALGEPDASGRRTPRPVPGSESVLPVEMAVEALGQEIPDELARALGGLVREGRVTVDPRTGATGLPGVFAGGDLVNGGATVVRAVAEGMRAAAGIDDYLAGSRV
ncbi:MAG: FAD-dependent oxidoreductase, partial [Bacteroidota bacterium]